MFCRGGRGGGAWGETGKLYPYFIWCQKVTVIQVCLVKFFYRGLQKSTSYPELDLRKFLKLCQASTRHRDSILKGQCHEIFEHFFGLKETTWAPGEQAITVLRNFLFLRKYSRKNVCIRNLWIHWHGVSVNVDYADTVSAWPLLRRYHISVVHDYADTVLNY